MQQISRVFFYVLLAAGLIGNAAAFAQSSQAAGSEPITGTVSSVTENTMIVRSESGAYVLFVLDRRTAKPDQITPGTRVTVYSRLNEDGTRQATNIVLTTGTTAPPSGQAGVTDEPIPPEVRRIERQIERQVRRFRVGVRGGVGLDPEIITGGLHAKLGPFFNPDLFFRPNAEIGFGEVSTLIALNLEAVYRLPVTAPTGRWSAYVGMGPGLNLIDRNFEESRTGDRDVDFDDLDFDPSFNILAGIEFRSGMFLELKSSAYGRPHVRLLVGYNF